MFKQITDLAGNEIYLIISLWIFIIFFVVVGILLFTMKKEYTDYMLNIPLDEDDKEQEREPIDTK